MEKYKNIGLKLTPQRLAVLQYLEGNKTHPSAEDIYRALKRRFPTISFATVYNILEALKEKGLVQELNIDPQKKRFDPDTSLHHHLICTECGKVVDLNIEYTPRITDKEAEGFMIKKVHMEFYGICQDCRSGK